MNKCNCKVCSRNKDFYEKLALLPEPQRAYWEGLYDDLCNAEMDNNYHDAILKGQWPSGKDVLLHAKGQWPSGKDVLLHALEKYKDES